MPTGCERNTASTQVQQQQEQQKQKHNYNGDNDENKMLDDQDINGDMSTSQTSTTSSNGCNGNNSSSNNFGGRKTSITSPDPTAYVAKERITRPAPPPPSYNPMQFVQIKPCSLYQTAQQQIKKVEEVKKIKEIKKEEPEEWQNNLDNWKSSRRKRVEHIIDRVVEVKKLELEEHDRSRRKSKTFSEMIEERGERGGQRARTKLASLAVYNEDESNDLSDLGIGTSSASGKSSLSEDYDNNSVLSDNVELDRAIFENNHHQDHHKQNSITREYVSSPGYDTSSSTAPGSSPDPCEYTYEGAIQDYKQRVSRAATTANTSYGNNNNNDKMSSITTSTTSKGSTAERTRNGIIADEIYPTRRGIKIEDRLMSFEVTSPSDSQEIAAKHKVDVPKIDISKRKEIFENQSTTYHEQSKSLANSGGGAPKVTLRERFKFDASVAGDNNNVQLESAKKDVKRFSGDMTSIKQRLNNLEQQQNLVNLKNSSGGGIGGGVNGAPKMDIPMPPLKERLSSLHNAVTKDEVRKAPVVLIDARQLEIMKNEEANAQQRFKQEQWLDKSSNIVTINKHNNMEVHQQQQQQTTNLLHNLTVEELEVDCDDSGIHTADDNEIEQRMTEQEEQLNAAIAALALEEKQLEQASNAVNQIEAEFAELTSSSTAATGSTLSTSEQPCEMEFSINEALEMALEAIDKETTLTTTTTTTTETSVSKSNKAEKNEEKSYKHIKKINQKQNLNKTDEEKELTCAVLDNNNDEVNISKEPIYENISTASTPEVDVEAVIIIPNKKNSNLNYKYNIINKDKRENHDDCNNKNNNPTNKTNNAFANKTTKTIQTTRTTTKVIPIEQQQQQLQQQQEKQSTIIETANINNNNGQVEPYYQVPKPNIVEPYYDAPKHLRPIPVYENIGVFYAGMENTSISTQSGAGNFGLKMEPPREKPPPPPSASPPLFDDTAGYVEATCNLGKTWSSDNTYETIAARLPHDQDQAHHNIDLPSPPIKRMNSTKRIKKELRNKRSSFLGIEGSLDDEEERFLELSVAPPPDMAQLLQEERRLEKQLYLKAAGLCDSSDTGESRDSGVSENHSRQSSEHYTNSSEENEIRIESLAHNNRQSNDLIFHNEALPTAAQTPLLQTVKGNSAESWTESATAAAAATKSLTEATATANAKMLSIEEKIREQEEVLRVERELLQLEQEELNRHRESLMLRENMVRRELQHGAKMLMSSNRRSLQDLNGVGVIVPEAASTRTALPPHPYDAQKSHHVIPQQQIYANVPNLHQNYYQVATDYRKSMSDLNEFSKRLLLPPTPPTKPMRAIPKTTPTSNGFDEDFEARQQHSLNTEIFGGSLAKIATPATKSRSHIYSNYQHQSAHNLIDIPTLNGHVHTHTHLHSHGNMTRNTLHALSATPKPKYTDGWVQVQNRKSFDQSNLTSDPAWLSAYQHKRKSMPNNDAYHAYNNHWLVQEAEQRRVAGQQRRCPMSSGNTPPNQRISGGGMTVTSVHSNGKPLPDSVIQTLRERVQNKGIGERKRFEQYNNINNNNTDNCSIQTAAHQQQQQQQQQQQSNHYNEALPLAAQPTYQHSTQDKVLSVSGKKKCSHCGDELGRGAAMIIESLLLFYHISCFKCCVCHMQLGDGLNGTDVRVRNHKLHCQNCYSSDDGIKFSCV